jgi:hypothetical protein
MTKKDYKLIASTLRRMHPNNRGLEGSAHQVALIMWKATCTEFEEAFWVESSKFNRLKFQEACHVKP